MTTRYTIFVLLRATKEWLSLPREERRDFFTNDFAINLAKHPTVKMRYFDAEAFSTTCSDVATFETEDLQQYYFLMERLRDSKFCTVPYFEFVEIIPAIEEGFVAFEESLR